MTDKDEASTSPAPTPTPQSADPALVAVETGTGPTTEAAPQLPPLGVGVGDEPVAESAASSDGPPDIVAVLLNNMRLMSEAARELEKSVQRLEAKLGIVDPLDQVDQASVPSPHHN